MSKSKRAHRQDFHRSRISEVGAEERRARETREERSAREALNALGWRRVIRTATPRAEREDQRSRERERESLVLETGIRALKGDDQPSQRRGLRRRPRSERPILQLRDRSHSHQGQEEGRDPRLALEAQCWSGLQLREGGRELGGVLEGEHTSARASERAISPPPILVSAETNGRILVFRRKRSSEAR